LNVACQCLWTSLDSFSILSAEGLETTWVDVPLTLEHGNVSDENSDVRDDSQPVVVSDRVCDDVYERMLDGVYEGVTEPV
jgi:hypothetical protein